MQKTTPKKIEKGDVYLIENSNAVGYVQSGIRPHVIVTQVTGETVTVAPCTSQKKLYRKYVVEIAPTSDNGLNIISYVLLAQSFAADTSLLQKKIGHLDQDEVVRIQLEYVKYVTD